jgi:beta-lactamase regulating signal transducer with metallopeptidase domain
MTAPELQTLAQLLTERLLNSAPEGLIIAGLTGLLLRFTARQNANARFAVWFAALIAIVALPFYGGANSSGLTDISSQLHGGMTLTRAWAFYLFTIWAVIAGLLVVRLCAGLWRLRQLRNNCSELKLDALSPEVAGILRDFGSRHRVGLCVSSDVGIPSAIGFVHPSIIFPAWLLPQLSPGEVEVILHHELAHLQRGDTWTNLIQKIVRALFFFHPAVWWIENRLTLEREMACDDIVLAQTARPRDYASFLISFAGKLHGARGSELAQALLARMHHMSSRVAQILDVQRPRQAGFWKPALRLSIGLLVLVLATAPYVPRLVAIENQPSAIAQRSSPAKQETQQALAASNSKRELEAPPVQASAPVRKARAIRAAYAPGESATPRHRAAKQPGEVRVIQAKAQSDGSSSQGTTFVIVQTVRYGDAGWVRTLSVWRVKGGPSAERQLESVLGLTI